jgi:hypothetical protein
MGDGLVLRAFDLFPIRAHPQRWDAQTAMAAKVEITINLRSSIAERRANVVAAIFARNGKGCRLAPSAQGSAHGQLAKLLAARRGNRQ